MYIPPRKKRGADKTCNRTPRMLSAVTVGAVALGATFGITSAAAADPSTPLVVDIVGDSYMAGDGMADTYMNPADLRHRSLVSPALQALSRVANENPGLQVDANVVASSGAVTANYFNPQKGLDAQGNEVVVNTAQHSQIRPNAQVVIVGFGGNDAELAEVLSIAKPNNASTPGDLDVMVKNFGGLLDTDAPEQVYLDQASASQLGSAPTLVSRMLQVLAGISNRAPNARIIVTNYPVPVDPDDPLSAALIDKRDLITVQKFLLDVNETIKRAVEICACANLADLTAALDGHEAYTDDSAYAEPAEGDPHPKAVRPNDEGAALMADPLATDLASLLGIRSPRPGAGKVTVPKNIVARSGESDVDGDLVPDFEDEAPGDRDNHRLKENKPDRSRGDDHRDGSRDRSRDAAPKRTDSHRDRGPRSAPDALDLLGLNHDDKKPKGNIPIQLLPPLAPAPKREPDVKPDDRSVAEPEAAERKPGRIEVAEVPLRDSGRSQFWDPARGEDVQDEDVQDEDLRDDVWIEDTGQDVEPDDGSESEDAESDDPQADGVESDRVGFVDVTRDGDVEVYSLPVESDAVPEVESDRVGYGDVTPEDVVEVQSLPVELGEQVEAVPEPAPAPAPAPAPEEVQEPSEWAAPPEVVERVAPEAAPAPEQPVDEAADGQQVCILIYPAPDGCGS